ncbi:MAG: NYN domain-containing protein [Candidatus Atribacteria bacterium]|nr:NYN domain-containing protein [Candidatus Atribacteria bacterium]
MKKVIFYIDGFNFYHGLKEAAEKIDNNPTSNRWKKFYWIDFVKFCAQFLNNDEQLVYVKYFTARPLNTGKRERQNILMSVNQKLNNSILEIHYGKYIEKEIICRASCGQPFTYPEEKQTDVNIAIAMLEDYITGLCDKTILISADSDLAPPLKAIARINKRKGGNHEIEVLFPPGRFSSDLYNSHSWKVTLLKGYRSMFNASLLPVEVKLKNATISIPPRWRKFLENKPGG